MKPINEMRLTLDSLSRNESYARVAIASFVAQLDPTIEELADIKTAVSEAVTNCIVHAYPGGTGRIYILAQIYPDGRALVRVRDTGIGIPDVARAMQPLYTTGGDDRAGLGFAVMQSFMDKLRVKSASGRGCAVTMEKQIERRPRGYDTELPAK